MSFLSRIAASIIAMSMLALPNATVQSQPTTNNFITWLAAGDSVSAGEGLYDSPDALADSPCQRAQGRFDGDAGAFDGNTDGGQTAWPVIAAEWLKAERDWPTGFASMDFVACTGAKSWNFHDEGHEGGRTQLEIATQSHGDVTWDVVSFNFGANNIGFSKIVKDCVGLDLEGFSTYELYFEALTECDISEEEMLKRIASGGSDVDDLSPSKGIAADLKDLFSAVEDVVAQDGLVLVVGYPQLMASPASWGTARKANGRCNRISEDDIWMLRRVGTALNDAIEAAVDAQSAAHDDATWLFVDVEKVWNEADGDHGLCGETKEWVNDLQLLGADYSWRPDRSFHPNQYGHGVIAIAAIDAIDSNGWRASTIRSSAGRDFVPVLSDRGVGTHEWGDPIRSVAADIEGVLDTKASIEQNALTGDWEYDFGDLMLISYNNDTFDRWQADYPFSALEIEDLDITPGTVPSLIESRAQRSVWPGYGIWQSDDLADGTVAWVGTGIWVEWTTPRGPLPADTPGTTIAPFEELDDVAYTIITACDGCGYTPEGVAEVTGTDVNVRNYPRLDSSIIGKAQPNQSYTATHKVTNEGLDWYFMIPFDESEWSGYVAAEFVELQ